jgi:hypothetical protein
MTHPMMPSMAELQGECSRCGAIWRANTPEARHHECLGLPKPGAYRWSNFFGSYIELVKYVSDARFYFQVVNHRASSYWNKSEFHLLPLRKPGT